MLLVRARVFFGGKLKSEVDAWKCWKIRFLSLSLPPEVKCLRRCVCNACDHLISPRHPFRVKSLLPLLMTPLSWYHMLCKSTNHNTHTSSHLISPRHPFSCQDVVVANDAALLLCYHMLCKRCSTNYNTDAHTHTHTQRYENRQPFLRRDVITSVWWTFDLIPTHLKQWQAWWCSTKRRQILYMKQRGEIFSRLDRGTT